MKIQVKYFLLIIFIIPFLISAQGYYNGENFGNRSILLSGNVTGSVDDLGLAYYNPARLALIEDPVFTINAKAYQFSNLKFENVFGRDSKLDDTKFDGVPSLIAGTFSVEKWEKHHFAYAFLSKERSRLNFNINREIDLDNMEEDFGDQDRLFGNFQIDNKRNDEWFGVSWGMKLKENLSIGVSTFVSIFNYSGLYDLRFASSFEDSGVDAFNNRIKFGQNSYGIFWKLGIAWQLDKFDLGLNVDLPYLEVIKNGKFQYQRVVSGVDPEDEDFQFYDFDELETSRKTPLGISFGFGWPFGKNKLHFKADWHAGISEYDRLVIPPTESGESGFAFNEELRSVINFGIGAEFYLNEKLNIYGSFSTDFSPVESAANLYDFIDNEDEDANFDADFMHYGLGLDIKLKKLKLVVGTTYSTASGDFSDPIDFPLTDVDVPVNDDPSRITQNRWRIIVGLEIPLFGYDVEFK
jgi:long-subunit fatty acid transport protein